jgi:hypothetical protein
MRMLDRWRDVFVFFLLLVQMSVGRGRGSRRVTAITPGSIADLGYWDDMRGDIVLDVELVMVVLYGQAG